MAFLLRLQRLRHKLLYTTAHHSSPLDHSPAWADDTYVPQVLVFVNTVDTGYKVKLFLESFGIRAALLNAEMPLNSRAHCLAAFNKGAFDYLIATGVFVCTCVYLCVCCCSMGRLLLGARRGTIAAAPSAACPRMHWSTFAQKT